jgi:hypothetical protein
MWYALALLLFPTGYQVLLVDHPVYEKVECEEMITMIPAIEGASELHRFCIFIPDSMDI